MSKSRGNLVFVSSLREEGTDPRSLRLALLAHHYRSDWEWTDRDLVQARERIGRWTAALDHATAEQVEPLVHRVRDRLADDLDTPGALAAIDAWAADAAGGEVAAVGDGEAAVAVRDLVDARLGVRL